MNEYTETTTLQVVPKGIITHKFSIKPKMCSLESTGLVVLEFFDHITAVMQVVMYGTSILSSRSIGPASPYENMVGVRIHSLDNNVADVKITSHLTAPVIDLSFI